MTLFNFLYLGLVGCGTAPPPPRLAQIPAERESLSLVVVLIICTLSGGRTASSSFLCRCLPDKEELHHLPNDILALMRRIFVVLLAMQIFVVHRVYFRFRRLSDFCAISKVASPSACIVCVYYNIILYGSALLQRPICCMRTQFRVDCFAVSCRSNAERFHKFFPTDITLASRVLQKAKRACECMTLAHIRAAIDS